MGRPTTEKKDKTVKLRISEEMYESLGGGNVSEKIRELIRGGVIKRGEILKGEYVPQKELSRLYVSIHGVCEGNAKDYLESIERSDWSKVRIIPEAAYKKVLNDGNNVPQNTDLMDKAVEKDLVDMCRLSGISTHDFFRGVCELWNDGEIGIDGEKVRSLGHYNIERFVELCHIMNIKPQETIDKITRSMEKGV